MAQLIVFCCACAFSGVCGIWLWNNIPNKAGSRLLGFVCPVLFFVPELTEVIKTKLRLAAERRLLATAYEPQLVSVIENLRGCLKAGMPLADALEFVYVKKDWIGAIDAVLKTVCQCRERGMAVRESLHAAMFALPRVGPQRFLRQLLHSLMIGQEMGGNVTKLLEKVQQKTQDSMELQRKIKVSTAQMRMQAWVVTLAPLVLAIILLVLSPGYILFFFQSVPGLLLLALMIFLNIVGAVLLKQISKVDEIC